MNTVKNNDVATVHSLWKRNLAPRKSFLDGCFGTDWQSIICYWYYLWMGTKNIEVAQKTEHWSGAVERRGWWWEIVREIQRDTIRMAKTGNAGIKNKTSRCPAVSSFYGVFLSLLLMFIKIITDTEQKIINKETLHLYRWDEVYGCRKSPSLDLEFGLVCLTVLKQAASSFFWSEKSEAHISVPRPPFITLSRLKRIKIRMIGWLIRSHVGQQEPLSPPGGGKQRYTAS